MGSAEGGGEMVEVWWRKPMVTEGVNWMWFTKNKREKSVERDVGEHFSLRERVLSC